MKSLFIISIGIMILSYSGPAQSQTWKDKLGVKKSGKVYAKDLSDEDVENLVYHKLKVDDGIISDYQKSNLNKVVFSGTKLEPSEVNGANVKTKFGINDPLFFNVILPMALPNYIVYPQNEFGEFITDYYYDYSFKQWGAESGSYNTDRGMPIRNIHGSTSIEVYLDGERIECPIGLRGVNTNSRQTIYSDWIFDDPKNHDPQLDWADLVQNLPEGEHEVKLVVYSRTNAGGDVKCSKEPIAEGSFKLVKSPGETFAPKFDLNWADFKAGINESELNSKLLKEIQAFGQSQNYEEVFDAVKVRSSTWSITRDPLTSAVTGRNIIVFCKAKWPDGFCKVQKFVFRQEYVGSDYTSDINCLGVYRNTGAKSIDCK